MKPLEFRNEIFNENCLTGLKKLPANSVDCCVTSPPYYALRDYGTAVWIGGDEKCLHTPRSSYSNRGIKSSTLQGSKKTINHQQEGFKSFCKKCGAKRIDEQIGLEETPEQYVQNLVSVFNEVYRVLKPTGTLWLNLGDSYAAGKIGRDDVDAAGRERLSKHGNTGYAKKDINKVSKVKLRKAPTGLKPKDLIGIPWMVAFALRSAGWYLRQDIIWQKPNPMPEPVTDRCTKSHEYIFLFSKSSKYFYDAEAIRVPLADESIARLAQDIENQTGSARAHAGKKTNGHMKAVISRNPRPLIDIKGGNQGSKEGIPPARGKAYTEIMAGSGVLKNVGRSGYFDANGNLLVRPTANKKSVWTVATQPFPDAHFATFPSKLIIDCIKAGTSEHGNCTQCGAPWVREFSKKLMPTKKAAKTTVVDQRDLNADALDQGSNRAKDGHKPGHANQITTTGWRPNCKCDCDTVEPPLVLDPFGGALTTALVARLLNRHYVMFELNANYIKIGIDRLYNKLGMFI